jgi:hypothetical protein
MKLSDPNNPNEKKKMIAAAALGLGALIVLGYVFFGGSSTPANNSNRIAQTSPTPRPATPGIPVIDDAAADANCSYCQKIVYPGTMPAVSEASRNIFAFYIPPSPTPKPLPTAPLPSPTPPPPLIASSLSPSNVYAGTPADFSLQVNGDKFTPAVHVFVDWPRFADSVHQRATSVHYRAGERDIESRNAAGRSSHAGSKALLKFVID